MTTGRIIGLLGGSGLLGSEICRTASGAGYEVIAPASATVDIRNQAQLDDWVATTRADTWINCAAYTAVDAAENDIASATALNVDGPANLTRALIRNRSTAPLIYLSTDYVFPGEPNTGSPAAAPPYQEDSPPAPRSVYGSTKLAGETNSLKYSHAIVLRVSWVFGLHGRNFVASILRAARQFDRTGGALKVVDDQLGAPCGTRAITHTLLQLLAKDAEPGIYHLACQPYVSWHGFAQAVVEEAVAAGLLGRAVGVLPQATSDLQQKAHRPADGRLDGTKLQSLLDAPAPEWRDDLRTLLAELDVRELDNPH